MSDLPNSRQYRLQCPRCSRPMTLQKTEDLPFPSGTAASLAALDMNSTGLSLTRRYVYVCGGCGHEITSPFAFQSPDQTD